MAATAISALTITGIPMLAESASADAVNSQVTTVTLLSQANNQASVKPDGTDSTVRLEAAAPDAVTAVTFQYSSGGAFVNVANGANVTRNDNGAFSLEWTPPAELIGNNNVIIRVTGTPAVGGVQTDQQMTLINPAGSATASVNLATTDQVGVFQAPYGGTNGGQYVAVNGTSSATSGTVELTDATDNSPVGTGTVTAPAGATTGTFAGVADITGYTYDPAPVGGTNQLALGATLGSDDVESYGLYVQSIASVSATAKTPNAPAGQPSDVTVTVLDDQQKPVAGARVAANSGGAVQYTDGNGKATFTQAGGSTTFYYADSTAATGFQQGVDKKSDDVTIGQFVPAPTSLEATSTDGAAFDLDEYTAGDITVQTKDQNGGDFDAADASDLSYYWVVTPFDGTPATERFPTSGNATVTDDNNGEFVVPLPTALTDKSGTYELFAGLTANQGTGGIAQSKVLTVKAGQAKVSYEPSGDQSAAAGGEVALTGKLALEDGTGLPNRTVDATYTRGTVGSDPAKDAGITPASGSGLVLTRTFTTNAAGTFAVTVDDPAETPQGTEVGGSLESDNGFIAPSAIGIDFAGDDPGVGATVAIDPINGNAKPGTVVSGSATVLAADGTTAVAGQRVTLTTDKGFFTNGNPDPDPVVGADAGEFASLGDTITRTTGANGKVSFQLAIERDEDFDDDGLAEAIVTATAGTAATDTEDVDFSSADPINGGEVLLTVSPEGEQDGGTDPARTGQDVAFDVAVTDQFGNKVGGELVTITEDGDDATISATDQDTGTPGVQVEADFDDGGDFTVTSTEDDDVKVTASWTTDTLVYTVPTGNGAPLAGTETLTDSETVTFFEVNLADADVTLTGSPEEKQETGRIVTETLTVLDSQGRPISGLQVDFTQVGPGKGTLVERSDVTDANGQAFYRFIGEEDGVAGVLAEITDGEEVRSITDTVEFVPAGGNGGNGGGRDPIAAVLKANDNGKRKDRIKIITRPAAEGAKVKLFKVKKGGNRKLIGKDTINLKGKAKFVKKDRNKRKRTQYIAVVKRTATTKGATTNAKRVV